MGGTHPEGSPMLREHDIKQPIKTTTWGERGTTGHREKLFPALEPGAMDLHSSLGPTNRLDKHPQAPMAHGWLSQDSNREVALHLRLNALQVLT